MTKKFSIRRAGGCSHALARSVSGPGSWARRPAAVLVGGVLVAAVLVAPTMVLGVPEAAASGPCTTTPQTINGTDYLYTTCTYTSTGGEQQFVMPPGVSLPMTVYAIGAGGEGGHAGIIGGEIGDVSGGYDFCSPVGSQSTGSGGGGSEGAEVAGAIQDVPVGTTLYVEVGGTGSYGNDPHNPLFGPASLGGWNGAHRAARAHSHRVTSPTTARAVASAGPGVAPPTSRPVRSPRQAASTPGRDIRPPIGCGRRGRGRRRGWLGFCLQRFCRRRRRPVRFRRRHNIPSRWQCRGQLERGWRRRRWSRLRQHRRRRWRRRWWRRLVRRRRRRSGLPRRRCRRWGRLEPVAGPRGQHAARVLDLGVPDHHARPGPDRLLPSGSPLHHDPVGFAEPDHRPARHLHGHRLQEWATAHGHGDIHQRRLDSLLARPALDDAALHGDLFSDLPIRRSANRRRRLLGGH